MGRGARLVGLAAFLTWAFAGFAGRFSAFRFLDFMTVTSEAGWR
jgi:hypothetical protein